MDKWAKISDCGMYRYILTRNWDIGCKALTFVMLNPSVADASIDDPTIRRCIGFGKTMGYGAIHVVNLFALRATDPKSLFSADSPVGPENEQYLFGRLSAAQQGMTDIVCAWGAHPAIGDKATYFMSHARSRGVTLHCIGKTKSGAPRHPLYVKANRPLEVFQ